MQEVARLRKEREAKDGGGQTMAEGGGAASASVDESSEGHDAVVSSRIHRTRRHPHMPWLVQPHTANRGRPSSGPSATPPLLPAPLMEARESPSGPSSVPPPSQAPPPDAVKGRPDPLPLCRTPPVTTEEVILEGLVLTEELMAGISAAFPHTRTLRLHCCVVQVGGRGGGKE